MTVRYQVRVSHKRGRFQVRLARLDGDRERYVVLGTVDSRHEAEVMRERVGLDPASRWREPVKRGPKAADVRWTVFVRSLSSGRTQVTLERTERGERRSCSVAVCATRREAETLRERIKADPVAYWREPVSVRAVQSKRRAAARRAESAAEARRAAEPPKPVRCVRQPDGRWLLGCLLHTAASAMVCPVCARAAAETAAALTQVLSTERVAVMKRRAA